MIRRNMILILFMIWHSCFAFAEVNIMDLPPSLARLQEETIDNSGKLVVDKMFQILRDNDDVFSILPNKVANISKIVFSPPNYTQRNEYDAATSTLFLSQPQCKDRLRLSADQLLPVALHEFGHAIFESYVYSFLNREYLDRPENSKQKAYMVLTGDIAGAQKLQVPMVMLSLPFHELIADTISVLLLNNPDAMSDFFLTCGQRTYVRSYSYNYQLAGWTVGPLGGAYDRRHELYDPVRRHIWATFQSIFKGDKSMRSKILSAILKASMDQMKWLAAQDMTYEKYKEINQEWLNRDLMTRFDAYVGS